MSTLGNGEVLQHGNKYFCFSISLFKAEVSSPQTVKVIPINLHMVSLVMLFLYSTALMSLSYLTGVHCLGHLHKV